MSVIFSSFARSSIVCDALLFFYPRSSGSDATRSLVLFEFFFFFSFSVEIFRAGGRQ